MGVFELVPALLQLNRSEKLQVVQLLINDLAQEVGLPATESWYPVWSPYDCHQAAVVLLCVSESRRVAGIYPGAIAVSDDFDTPLALDARPVTISQETHEDSVLGSG